MWGRSFPFFSKVHNSSQFVDRKFGRAPWREISLGFLCLERNCWQGEEFRWLTSYQWTWRRSVLRARRKEGEGERGGSARANRMIFFSRRIRVHGRVKLFGIFRKYLHTLLKWILKKMFLQLWNNIFKFSCYLCYTVIFQYMVLVYCIYFTFPNFIFLEINWCIKIINKNHANISLIITMNVLELY